MKRKLISLITWILFLFVAMIGVSYFNTKGCVISGTILGAFIGKTCDKIWFSIEDLLDSENWSVSLRKLLRGRLITKNTLIRISFSYLYRIKVGNEYMLVKNARGTNKYQPVGGVYKLYKDERLTLNNSYHVVDDDNIPIDESSQDDYRLKLPSKYLRRFVKRFNSVKSSRERIDNVGREFKEELHDVFNWDEIQYRYCGRHMTPLKYGDHFQCYELLLADIVELLPTAAQQKELELLKTDSSDIYRFVTADQINCLGVEAGTDQLAEWIADHSKKVLQENEQFLSKESGTGCIYCVKL